ncbi:uncharacterized protein LOC107471560 [Arachis duranensis]|uniref:Uncharacterized protein LOC107471560 n=1 Tax=Arachis duranensis TaxID=130453 RepID=A0A6P4BV58_ARADU|nr:uncharacterized protein LOC107471560 [Arachis duranensis]
MVQQASLDFNSKIFGNIFVRKNKLEYQIDQIQWRLEVTDMLSLRIKEAELREDYNRLLLQEELFWYQKSREQWVKYGDRNTKFFHLQTLVHRNHNRVHGLYVRDGSWSTDPDSLQEEALSFYKNLFGTTEEVEVDCLGDVPMPTLSTEACARLIDCLFCGSQVSSIQVDWRFLESTLIAFGFPIITVNLIMTCVRASSLSIMWNGNRLDSFAPRRGLRQGNPMSFYLFVLCMEGLACYISHKVVKGVWKLVSVTRGGPKFSHLMFADDLLLFCQATKSQVQMVMHSLNIFCKASGMKVNLEKSKAFCSKNVTARRRDIFTSVSSIRFALDLGRYLGVNLNHSLYLINSVAASIPTYHMQVSFFPNWVCDKLSSMMRQFLWKGQVDGTCLSLVNWRTVITPKKFGGLGVRDPACVNISLLGKLVWQFFYCQDKPWVALLRAKYLRNEGVLDGHVPCNASHVWKSISKAFSALKDSFSWCVGSLDQSFWFDNWSIEGPIAQDVPFVHISDSDLTIRDVWKDGQWNLHDIFSIIPEDVKQRLNAYNSDLNAGESSAEFRLGRGLALSSTCHRCQNGSESILHCLRECPSAKEVWTLLGLYSDNSNLHDWLYRGARSGDAFLFFSTIWWIWRSRNHDLFNIDDSWSASKVVSLIRSSVREFHTIFAMHQSLSPLSLCLHWVPPPVHSVKLNCDASWFAPSGYAGFGCIIRNPDGCWLKGCTEKVEVCSVLFAELYAIWRGLLLAWESGFREVICETDCLEALFLVNQRMLSKDIPEWDLAKHIQEVMNWNWRVSILLIQRTANSVADCMAKAAASVADIHLNWSQPWSELQHLIDLDMTLAN